MGNEKRSEKTGTDGRTRTGRDAITKSVVLVRVRVRLSVNQFKASIPIQRLSYPNETGLSSKISRNTLVLPLKDCPRKPLREGPSDSESQKDHSEEEKEGRGKKVREAEQ